VKVLIEFLHHILLVASLTDDSNSHNYTGYEYDWIRQHQKANRERIKKYEKMKKRVNKLSRKNRVVKHK
jgi:hypothetical protein